MDEEGDDDEAPPSGHAALERAHTAKPDQLASLRGELEWATTQDRDAALWLALGVVYLRLGDRTSAETTLRHAEQRASEKQLSTALEITAALDGTRGSPLDYKGPGILRSGPKRRLYVELPDAKFRWAALRVGDLLQAGITPKVGETVNCKARLGRRAWEVISLQPSGQLPRGTLGKDGTYVRCGELRFLPLVEPCPAEHLRWDDEAWKTTVAALPIRLGRDRKTQVVWSDVGVAGWAELANRGTAPAVEPAPPVDATIGKLSAKGKHLVIAGAARELIEADLCAPGDRRGRYSTWRGIVDALPYKTIENKVAVDWPELSTRHALEIAVESWAALAAYLDARPPPKRETSAPAADAALTAVDAALDPNGASESANGAMTTSDASPPSEASTDAPTESTTEPA